MSNLRSRDRRRSSMLSKGSELAMKEAHSGDQVSLAETASDGSSVLDEMNFRSGALHNQQCNACPFCNDRCMNPNCSDCDESECLQLCQPCNKEGERLFTRCQVSRHDNEKSAWLVAGRNIYDATAYLNKHHHPGGVESILRKAGGKEDCLRDLQFHSRAGANTWKKYHIGVLHDCRQRFTDGLYDETPWWVFWKQ